MENLTENLIFEYPSALFALPVLWLIFVALAWRRRFKPFGPFLLRLMIIVLLILALAQPVQLPEQTALEQTPEAERVVILVDQSASLGEDGRRILQQEASRLSSMAAEAFVFHFADQPVLVESPHPADVAGQAPQPLLNPEISAMPQALAAASALFNQQQPGRVILLSDGLSTQGDAFVETNALRERNIPVDTLLVDEATRLLWRGGENEVRLVRLRVPPVLRQGEQFVVEVTVHSEQAIEVILNLTQGETSLAESEEELQAGYNIFSFDVQAETVGGQQFRATVAVAEEADVYPENNRLAAFAQVYPPPRVLVISADEGQTDRMTTLLEQSGFLPDSMLPTDLPSRLSVLEPYAGMVLVDVSARDLALDQMLAVQEFARSLGRGLLFTGGRNSLSLGGYDDTPLAETLPVTMEPPPREERAPVALLLVVDHSGSMSEMEYPATKLAMAKEAAIRSTDILGPEDLLGVMMFDNRFEWVVPFKNVSDGADLLAVQEDIALIFPGGGTRILQALEASLPTLAEQSVPGGAKHAVLLTDGKSFDGLDAEEAYERLLDEALAADITLSTIAIGSGADQELLQYLAEKGRGRYHFAAAPEELPALTVAESDILRSNTVQEGDFEATTQQSHPMTRGFFRDVNDPAEASPPLFGYLALTPKPLAETALQVGPGDPLLTVWGYGLGRVAVWTSDTGQEWATAWSTWLKLSRFWGQIIGYTLPAPDLGLLQLETEIAPDGVVTLIANGVTADGQTVDLAPTEALLTTPGGQENQIRLLQTAPGEYRQAVQLNTPGAYQVQVSQTRPEAETETATVGFVLPYPAEYALPDSGMGEPLLQAIASLTAGQPFSVGQTPPGLQVAALPIEAPPAPEDTEPLRFWPWLLGAALILWPLEIAWRRWARMRIQ